jgi:hypothetical protein
MEIQEKHTTQIERKLESLSALVLTLKNESFLYSSGKKKPTLGLKPPPFDTFGTPNIYTR